MLCMYVANHETILLHRITFVQQLTTNLKFWLLGYEFPATLMVFTQATMYIVTTEKKGKDLRTARSTQFADMNQPSTSRASRMARFLLRSSLLTRRSPKPGHKPSRNAATSSKAQARKSVSLRRSNRLALSSTSGRRCSVISPKTWKRLTFRLLYR